MKLGIGQAVLTPPIGTPLAGFGFRDHGSEGVLDDLEAKVLWFQDGESAEEAVCIVTADILGFGPSVVEDILGTLSREHGIPPERVLLAASHTHSGPQIDDLVIGTGATVPEVVAMIRDKIIAAVGTARNDLQPVVLHAGTGICEGFAINRRHSANGRVEMAPNPNGPRDDKVTAIVCRNDSDGRVRAVLFHFTCHPSTIGSYLVTADYPGVARRHIEKSLGNGAVAAFLPGCCGDVRSYCTVMGGKTFRSGTPEDINAFGTALGTEVVNIVRHAMEPVTPRLSAKKISVDIPLAQHPSRKELETLTRKGDALEKAWAWSILSKPFSNVRSFYIQRIDLAKEVTLMAMSGEVCSEYGHFVRKLRPNSYTVPLGYSNGVIGYIPTAAMFPEGGYEPDRSSVYYGLPSPFTPELEWIIQSGLRRMMNDDC
jgi:hypothetical protein